MAAAMADEGLDQSALARAVGCTPGAINQILAGGVHRSRFLPDIADTLKVSLRWLRGEDVPRDPAVPIPPAPPTPQPQFVTMQVAMPSEAALARMFEGLLRPIDLERPVAEIAQMLAKRLPTGLSQLRDLLPVPDMVERKAAGEGLQPLATVRPAPPRAPRT